MKTQFNSLRQASVVLNIPKEHLKVIKGLYADGFTKNGSVIGPLVLDYYNKNKALIESTGKASEDNLTRKRLQNIIILQELEIEEKRRQMINIKEVEDFQVNLGIQLGATLKNKLVKELPPRVVGLKEDKITELCKEYYNETLKVISDNLTEWAKMNDQSAKT